MVDRRIYLASSWRNPYQPELVEHLRRSHAVYDFRNPRSGGPKRRATPAEGFSWRETMDMSIRDPRERLRQALKHPIARAGYEADKAGMDWSNTCVLALPAGRSAHLEFGYLAGAGKHVLVYMPPILELCARCNGTGWIDDPIVCTRNVRCFACTEAGFKRSWELEPELMYLVGGPDVVVTSLDELDRALLGPMPKRKLRR